MRCFNRALLAKQAWRIATETDCLLSRTIKAKYFPNSSFWEARKESNASLSWQSIMETKQLLDKGIRRRVGNGMQINVWHDKWIPRNSTYRIVTRLDLLNSNMRVAELIEENGRRSNEELIRNPGGYRCHSINTSCKQHGGHVSLAFIKE
ncbi:UNVERIFIED_CONTAM: hypothetical protein Sradi_2302200 [Sesamum radiatum]|uniref:Uncharacterized protein n=1 Tax=Sesamum radiatum TaxID=300843 RepID=A0AAW2T594_SESRA